MNISIEIKTHLTKNKIRKLQHKISDFILKQVDSSDVEIRIKIKTLDKRLSKE